MLRKYRRLNLPLLALEIQKRFLKKSTLASEAYSTVVGLALQVDDVLCAFVLYKSNLGQYGKFMFPSLENGWDGESLPSVLSVLLKTLK